MQGSAEFSALHLGFSLVGAALILATVVAWLCQIFWPQIDVRELRMRTRSWWFVAGIFAVAISLNRTVALVSFAFLSFLALKEYLSLIPTRRADRRVLFWVYLVIPAQYHWIAREWFGMFVVFVPVYMFLLVPARMVGIGATSGFLKAAGSLHWGLMITVFSVSHLAYLFVLPGEDTLPAGGPGLVFFVVVLTELNDLAQYLIGKTLGRSRIVPSVSPRKTWAGFLGGVATTVSLAVLAGPLFTPLASAPLRWGEYLPAPWFPMIAAGLLISVGGFVGDVVMSAVKRDLGIEPGGTLRPGHGGVLDRIDSLIYTGPLFFHFVYYLYF